MQSKLSLCISEVLCIIGQSGHLLQHICAHSCLCLSASIATTVGLMLADFFYPKGSMYKQKVSQPSHSKCSSGGQPKIQTEP